MEDNSAALSQDPITAADSNSNSVENPQSNSIPTPPNPMQMSMPMPSIQQQQLVQQQQQLQMQAMNYQNRANPRTPRPLQPQPHPQQMYAHQQHPRMMSSNPAMPYRGPPLGTYPPNYFSTNNPRTSAPLIPPAQSDHMAALQSQMSPAQRAHMQNLSRASPTVSINSQATTIMMQGQSSASANAQWITSPGKHTQSSNLPIAGTPLYQANFKQQISASKPQNPQSQQLLMPSQQAQVINQSQEQLSQEFQQTRIPNYGNPGVQQPHYMQQTQGANNQKTHTAVGQLNFNDPTNLGSNDQSNGQILTKRSIQELISQIDPREKLDSLVEDVLIELAEEFVDSVSSFACSLAKHRKSDTIEPKDILLPLERDWNITIPGFASEEYRTYKKPTLNDSHKQRMQVIRKSVASSQSGSEAGNPKDGSGQANANSNSKVPTAKGSQEAATVNAQENS